MRSCRLICPYATVGPPFFGPTYVGSNLWVASDFVTDSSTSGPFTLTVSQGFGFGSGALWAIVLGALVDALGFRHALYVMAASYSAAALWILPLHEGFLMKRRPGDGRLNG